MNPGPGNVEGEVGLVRCLTMKRALLYTALAMLAAVAACRRDAPAAEPEPPVRPTWAVLFYLPYDNNLDWAYDPILTQIEEAIVSPEVIALVQADRAGDGGVSRTVVTNEGTHTEAVDSDLSADATTFAQFLSWGRTVGQARRHVVIVAGHAGPPDGMAYDHTLPSDRPATRWLHPARVGDALREWPVGSGLTLVFLQQCGRASVETLFEMRDTAPVVIASEADIGVPNYYYGGLLRALAASADLSPVGVAEAIMGSERSDMYVQLTAFDGHALAQLNTQLATALGPLQRPRSRGQAPVPESQILTTQIEHSAELTFEVVEARRHVLEVKSTSPLSLRLFGPDGAPVDLAATPHSPSNRLTASLTVGSHRLVLDLASGADPASATVWVLPAGGFNQVFGSEGNGRAFDLVEWLTRAYDLSGLDASPATDLGNWVRNELIVARSVSPCCADMAGSWSGVSLFVPRVAGEVEDLASFDVYGSIPIAAVFEAMLDAPSAQ